jgi:exosome complex RNA-binding protein Rrp42 (RNase PH superfamily)
MDRKRVNGPELSVAPIEENVEKNKDIFDSAGKRLDGRSIEDIRPICKYRENRSVHCDLANINHHDSHEDWLDNPG